MDVSKSLVDSLDEFFLAHPDIAANERFAVALSGGGDSMALTHALSCWAKENHTKIIAITVDHDLRSDSSREAEVVQEWVHEWPCVDHVILRWEDEKPVSGMQNAAREARYKLMADYCDSAGIRELFVAHHLDDQAETVLLRLAKGSSVDGLSAMADVTALDDRVCIVRPLLDRTHSDLLSYCSDNGVPWIEDPSNEKVLYARNRLRMARSALESEGLTNVRLGRLAQRMRRVKDALDYYVEREYSYICLQRSDCLEIDWGKLHALPKEVAFRIFVKALGDVSSREFAYGIRTLKAEKLFEELWVFEVEGNRTLGGCVLSLSRKKALLRLSEEKSRKNPL